MKIIHNNFKIEFDNSLLPVENTNRVYETSYLNTFKVKDGKVKIKKDSHNKIHCYQNILEKIGPYNSLLDIFGGVGITAKMFDKGETYVNEIDKNCLFILKQHFKNVINCKIEKFLTGDKYDLVLADYNNFTIKKFLSKGYVDTLKKCFEKANKYVILNDSSIFFLKYGKKSFEIYSDLLEQKVNNKDEFFKAQKIFFKRYFPKWNMINVEYFNNASIILFSKENKELNVSELRTYKELIKLEL